MLGRPGPSNSTGPSSNHTLIVLDRKVHWSFKPHMRKVMAPASGHERLKLRRSAVRRETCPLSATPAPSDRYPSGPAAGGFGSAATSYGSTTQARRAWRCRLGYRGLRGPGIGPQRPNRSRSGWETPSPRRSAAYRGLSAVSPGQAPGNRRVRPGGNQPDWARPQPTQSGLKLLQTPPFPWTEI